MSTSQGGGDSTSRTSVAAPPVSSRRRSTVTGLNPQVNVGPKTSIISIINARRFTRKFTSSLLFRKRTNSGISVSNNQPQIRLEPTYRTEPRRRFMPTMARESIEKIVQKHMTNREYNPAKGQLMAKVLAEEVKQDVKSFGFERFKVVVHAVVGEKTSTSAQVASRTLSDPNFDNHVTVNFENGSIFASVTAYVFYND